MSQMSQMSQIRVASRSLVPGCYHVSGQVQRLSPDCSELAEATDHDQIQQGIDMAILDEMRPSHYNPLRQVIDKSPPLTRPTTPSPIYVPRTTKGELIIIETDSDNDSDDEAEGGVASSDLITSSEDQCVSDKSIVDERRPSDATPLGEGAGGSCDHGRVCDIENELRQTPEGTEGSLHSGTARSQCKMINGDGDKNGIDAIGGDIGATISNCQQLNEGLQHQQEEDGATTMTPLSQDRQQSVRPYHKDNEHDEDDDDEDVRPPSRRKRRYVEPTIAQAQTHTTRSSTVSRSSPANMDLTQSADYQEYPFQGIYKRVRIGRETTYNLQFTMLDLPDSLRPSIDLQMANSTFSGKSVRGSAYPRVCASHAKKSQPVVQKRRKRQPLRERVKSDLVEIDATEEICQVEALLAKSAVRNVVWYLVKWEGFGDDKNTWQERDDISSDLIDEFEASYRGNFASVELLKKRERRGKIEYFVKWKGRPAGENSWEKEDTIHSERIKEFEAR